MPRPDPDRAKAQKPRSRRLPLMAALAVALGLGAGVVIAEVGLRWQRSAAETFGTMDPGLFAYDPGLGWTLVPGAQINHVHPDFAVTYTVNANGHRGTRAPAPPGPDIRRIVWLGDSYTFGLGANDAEIFTEQLNRLTGPALLHLNLAVPGTSTDQQVLLAEDRAFALAPDLIVLAVYLGNDLIDNTLTYPLQAATAKPLFDLADGRLRLQNVPVPQQPKPTELQAVTFSSVVLGDHRPEPGLLSRSEILRRLGWQASVPDISASFDDRFRPSIDLFAALVDRLHRNTDLHGAGLAVVLLPGKSYVEDPGGYSGQYQDWARRQVLDRLAAAGIPALDLAAALRDARAAGRDDLFHPNEGHLTAAGHAFVAERVAAFLPSVPALAAAADRIGR